jgi:hypothetical protein
LEDIIIDPYFNRIVTMVVLAVDILNILAYVVPFLTTNGIKNICCLSGGTDEALWRRHNRD